MDKIQKDMQDLIAAWRDIPGVAVCLLVRGQAPRLAYSGIASLEHRLPIDASTRFNLASVSKQFTGFAVCLLEKRGLLSLDDRLQQHLPEFPDTYKDIRIHHLLHHTSGLRDMYNIQAYSGFRRDDTHTPEQLIALTLRQTGLNFPPGERYLYNNTGFVLLAEIVRRLTGRDLRTFLRDEVFAPLGMANTCLLRDHKEVLPGFAGHYNLSEAGEYTRAMENVAVSGSSNIMTTLPDFARWLGNYVTPTHEAAVMMALDRTRPFNDGSPAAYACGLEIVERGGQRIWTHSGGAGGFRTEMIYVPAAGTAVGVLSNNATMDAVTLGGQLLGLVLPELAPRTHAYAGAKPKDLDDAEVEMLAGCYRMPDGLLSTVVIVDRKPFIHTPYYPFRLPLIKVAEHKYRIDILGAELTAEYGEDGRLQTFSSLTPLGPMKAVKLPPIALAEAELEQYCGRYWSAELCNMWEVGTRDGRLVMFHPHFPALQLFPVLQDEFSSETENFEKLKFTRGADGRVNGLAFSGDRAVDIHFKRVDEIICRD